MELLIVGSKWNHVKATTFVEVMAMTSVFESNTKALIIQASVIRYELL